ncbi:unnamed protein product, partial [Ectocarpus fasciculatus]
YEELAQFAAKVQGLKLSAWEISTCLREIMVETVIARQVEFRLYSKASGLAADKADGPEDKTFKSPLQAVLFAGSMEGRFRLFIARTKASSRLHSRGANGVDGEPTLPWLLAGGTMQHPVVLDEATATRFGYGSSCVLGPAKAVRAVQRASGAGGEGTAGRRAAESEGESESGAVPEVGGYFRMWSDYRMALEGHASNVQAGALLPPVLDMARTVADTFRRRWAAGGEYPERVLARVRLAERGDEGDDDAEAGGGSAVVTAASFGRAEAVKGGGASGKEDDTKGSLAKVAERGRRERGSETEEDVGVSDDSQDVVPARRAPEDDREGATSDSAGGGSGQKQRQGQPPPHGGLRQVLSRLDGLDSGALVERALKDHLHGEGEEEAGGGEEGAPSGGGGSRRLSGGGGAAGGTDDDGGSEGETAALAAGPAAAVALSTANRAGGLAGDGGSATVTSTPDGDGEAAAAAAAAAAVALAGDGEASSASVRDREGAEAVEAGMQASGEEKFMLPGWHYLALSGRSLSMDFRWSNMDLVLMQDPTARQGRDTDKNVLALRSTGTLTVSSSGVGESVDVQLRDASLLPCFYADEGGGENDGGVYSPPATTAEAGGGGGGGGVPAQRLALILGGGESALRAVARTWLGQGLVTADSRPLLEPFTVQVGYGTVVAQAAVEGRGTGVTDGRRRRSSALSGHDDSEDDDDEDGDDDDGDGGLVVKSPVGRGEDSGLSDEDGGVVEGGGLEQSAAGETVAGVFRVAVAEVQLMLSGAKRKAEEVGTIEVEVDGQTRSFGASDVLPPTPTTAAVGEATVVELEFACRCRLRRRRRRGRRRRREETAADGGEDGGGTPGVSADPTALDSSSVGEQDGGGHRRRQRGAGAGAGAGVDLEAETGGEEDDGVGGRRDAEPEAAAKVRLLTAEGEVLGEALAELAGAPDGWARYPLYSPGGGSGGGDSGAERKGGSRSGSGETSAASAAATANSRKATTGLDRGGVIPRPPAAVRRRWGWGYRRDRGAAAPRSWFRPRPPSRDVAGEVRLRLGWVPSGLAVTVHRCRAGAAAAMSTASSAGLVEKPLLAGSGRRRLSILVSAEPGGGTARTHPVRDDGGAEAQDVWGSTAVDGPGTGEGPRVAVASKAKSSAQDDRLPSSGSQEVIPGGGGGSDPGTGAAGAEGESSERLFFVLDTSCLLGGWNGDGSGARLLLSAAREEEEEEKEEEADCWQGDRAAKTIGAVSDARKEAPGAAATAELLLFPGAEPARRWVPLTDPAGGVTEEVDVTIAWAVAPPQPPPPPLSPTRRPASSSTTAGGEAAGEEFTAVAATPEALVVPGKETAGGGGGDKESGGLDTNSAAAGRETSDKAAAAAATAGIASADESRGGEPFLEPAQVVSRCFSMHTSDLVFRVSDLDMAVLVTMAKGIVRILRPPKSKEEKELELEAVQQRLLEEANGKRNAAIQQLRATFQSGDHQHQGGADGPRASFDGDTHREELLNVRDVVELLRDFLRAKALTESEVSREAEEFMLVILAVEDEAKRRTPVRTRARSASPTSRRRASEGSPSTPSRVPADDLSDLPAPRTPSTGGFGGGVDSGSFSVRKRWRTRLRPDWRGGGRSAARNSSHEKLWSPAGAPVAAAAGGAVKSTAAAADTPPPPPSSSPAASAMPEESIEGLYSGGRRSRRRSGRVTPRRSSWRGVSISLDHFILALQSFMEEQPDEGYVMAR